MKLSSILNPDLILCNLTGNDRESIYRNMVKEMVAQIPLDLDAEATFNDAVKREDDIRLPFEKGLGLPHVRSASYNDLYITVGILKEPVLLKEYDLQPSKIIVFSLISENTADLYLKAISAFARLAMRQENIDDLAACRDPHAFLAALDEKNAVVKKEITAEDVMEHDFPSIRIDSNVSDALDLFTRASTISLPVLDEKSCLVGVLDAATIIEKSIPEYIMMLDNLKFLNSFEPFEKLFKKEDSTPINPYVRKPKITGSVSMPLIQVTVALVKGEAANIFIVDKDNVLLGVITMQEIIKKVLRG